MTTLKHILKRYTDFLWSILGPLGPWGVFVIAAADGAAVGLPMDPIVATYVYQNRSHFLFYVLLASLGSAIGSSFLYLIGYLGGETVLRKKISPERFDKIHRSFERHEFWAVMFPAMLPPPTPFKIFVLSAAAFEMNFLHFVLAVFAGRFVRFLILAGLTIEFGPQVVSLTGRLFTHHFKWVVLAVVVGLGIWWWIYRRRKSKTSAEVQNLDGRETT